MQKAVNEKSSLSSAKGVFLGNITFCVSHTRKAFLQNQERASLTTVPLLAKSLQNSEIISYQQVSRPDFSSVDKGEVTKVYHVLEATLALLVLLSLEEVEIGYSSRMREPGHSHILPAKLFIFCDADMNLNSAPTQYPGRIYE